MDTTNRRKIAVFMFQAVVIVICEVINALAFRSLIVPARLLSGGVVGAALLLNQLFNLPIGLQTMVYNLPIFVLGWRYLGRRFVVLSIVGVVSFSFLTDNLQVPILTHDLLLIAIFGGLATGIADGIILKAGGSTGGFDILGLIVSRRFGLSIGQVFLIFNGLIIALAAIFNNLELAMYTLIMLFVSTRTINTLLAATPRPVAMIVSSKAEEVTARLLHDIGRGVTYLQGSGAYTDAEVRVILCVISRYELSDIRRIVHEVDPKAFTIILEASDVIGSFTHSSTLRRLIG